MVLGVIAAITLPTMIADWQKQASVAGLKKAYSTLSQAMRRSTVDNGPVYTWGYSEIGGGSYETVYSYLQTYFYSYLNVAKFCGDGDLYSSNECSYDYKSSPNTFDPYRGTGVFDLFLADGTYIAAYDWDKNSIHFFVDINGYRKPNVVGRDIFYISLSDLRGYGKVGFAYNKATNRDTVLENCRTYSAISRGAACGKLIMMDGWQIKDDYPW